MASGCGEPVAPRLGEIRLAAQLREPRADLAAAMMHDGRILIAGGGLEDGTVLGSAEVFDPSTNSVAQTRCSLRIPRRRAIAVTLADGRVMVIGGDTGNLYPLLETEIYDPRTDCFTDGPLLRERRQSIDRAVLLRDGRVLVVLGLAIGDPGGGAEIFDPAAGEFVVVDRDLGKATEVGSVVVLSSGSVLMVGGYEAPQPGPALLPSARAVLLDPLGGTATELSTGLSEARSGLATVADDRGGAFLIGGAAFGQATNIVEYYDGTTRRIRVVGRLRAPRLYASTALVNGWILVVGGTSRLGLDPPLRSTEWLQPSGTSAAYGPSLEQGVEFGHHTFVLPDGRIAIVRASQYPSTRTAVVLVSGM